MVKLSTVLTGAIVASSAVAHPGHQNIAEELLRKREFMSKNPRSIGSCANQLERRGHQASSLARRTAFAEKIRLARGIQKRDFAEYNHSHEYTSGNINLGSDEMTLFSDNSSCVLQPEVTQGPFYVTGELIRKNITEDQQGVPMWLDIQLIDTSSCEPVPAVYMDIWHCNSTGVYGGVISEINGNVNDTSNINKTFLRGIQQTDSNGVVQFETIFPGHYQGRATHIHLLTHNTNDTVVRLNNTLLDSAQSVNASHVGQIFFDQDLISEVTTVYPYNTNNASITLNSDDDILADEDESMDPFVEWTWVGDSIEDGIIAWISIGIDPTTDDSIGTAAVHYADGGVMGTSSYSQSGVTISTSTATA